MRGNLFHRYSARGKWFETGIVPVAEYNRPLSRFSIHCSNIVNTNHSIKIKHFHILCTKLYYLFNILFRAYSYI